MLEEVAELLRGGSGATLSARLAAVERRLGGLDGPTVAGDSIAPPPAITKAEVEALITAAIAAKVTLKQVEEQLAELLGGLAKNVAVRNNIEVLGTLTALGAAQFSGRFAFSAPLLTWKIEAETDNGVPPETTEIILLESVGAERKLTGLSLTQVSGQIVTLLNIGTFALLLSERDTKSASANRFRLSGSAAKDTLKLQPFQPLQLQFASGNWKQIGTAWPPKAAAIAEPAAELVPLQKAVNEIRTVLKNANLTA